MHSLVKSSHTASCCFIKSNWSVGSFWCVSTTSFQVLPCTQEDKRIKCFYLDGLACSPFTLICTEESESKQMFLKSWLPAQARVPLGSGSSSRPDHCSLCGALGCVSCIIFSLNKEEFKLMLLCIMLENFMSLVQFTAKISQRIPQTRNWEVWSKLPC